MKITPFRICLGIGCLLFLACTGLLSVLLDFLIALFLGWINFLARVLPAVHVNRWGLATAVVFLGLIAIGVHSLLQWFSAQTVPSEGSIDRLKSWRWTGWLIASVVLMFVAGLAVGGVAHQVGWLIRSPESLVSSGSARDAARRAQSTNNLKQIGLALHNYHEEVGTFPPGGTFDRHGRPLHGWQTMILPYIENKDLFDRINLGVSWDDPQNAGAFRTSLSVYLNPGIRYTTDSVGYTKSVTGYALSHYAANVRMLGGDARRSYKDVTDGNSNTLMAGEVVSRFKPWGDPTNWRDPALGVNRSPDGFGSSSVGGANFLFVDGSVHFIKNSIDPRVLEALGTLNGGERISADAY